MSKKIQASELDNSLKQAAKLCQTGQFVQAKSIYKKLLRSAPINTEILSNLGTIEIQLGSVDEGIQLLQRSLKINPKQPNALFNIGNEFYKLKRYEDALTNFNQAIAINPIFAEAHCNKGIVLREQGEFEKAIVCYDAAIACQPSYARAHYNRSVALLDILQYEQALAGIDQAIALNPNASLSHFHKGLIVLALNRFDEALNSFRESLRLNPNQAEAFLKMGDCSLNLRDIDESIAYSKKALELNPNCVEAYLNLGSAYRLSQNFDEAINNYNKSIELKKNNAPSYFYLGLAFQDQYKFEEAIEHYDTSIKINPSISAYMNRGVAYEHLGDFNKALENYDSTITLNKDYAEAYLNKAFVKLLLGEYIEGWQLFEWRWKRAKQTDKRNFTEPTWLGDASISGKTVLIYTEQGFGDTLQFCRYVPMIESLGGHAIFEVPAPLLSVMESMKGNFTITERGKPLPSFDFQCSTMSLPLAFRSSAETIPAETPYFFADIEKVKRWQNKIGASSKLKIGLVWAGGLRPNQPELFAVNSRRNIQLEKLASLSAIDAEFYSLQKGEPAETELANIKLSNWAGPDIIDYTAQIQDFSDTAALIQNLDLVISVDTSTAHLAAALGKPVWLLNRFDTCWRWMLHRNDTPWYPNMRLFRQTHMGNWDNVLIEVVDELKHMIANNDNTKKKPHSA